MWASESLDAENTDPIMESSHKHGIYCMTEAGEIQINKSSEKISLHPAKIKVRLCSSYVRNVLLLYSRTYFHCNFNVM